MKRLTKRWGAQPYPNLAGKVICEYKECDSTSGCENCIHGRYKDRLAAIEDILGDEYDLDRLRELAQADREGRCFIGPFVAMIERSLSDGEMKPQRDQRFNGRYAVVYFDPKKWSSPLIDICGKPYHREEAEERMKELKDALRREQE